MAIEEAGEFIFRAIVYAFFSKFVSKILDSSRNNIIKAMHAIESIRTDIYEQCLNEALNYSANSGHIVRATLTGLAEALLKLSNHRQFGLQGVKALLLECFDKYWKQLAAVLGE